MIKQLKLGKTDQSSWLIKKNSQEYKTRSNSNIRSEYAIRKWGKAEQAEKILGKAIQCDERRLIKNI